MELFRIILRIALFVFFPAFLTYLGRDNNILDVFQQTRLLGESLNISFVKEVFAIASVSISNLILITLFEINHFRLKSAISKNKSLFSDLKASFLSALATELAEPLVHSIKFRVWKEKKTWVSLFKEPLRFPKSKIYVTIKVDGLSDTDNIQGLFYEVEPVAQGLIGRCYTERKIKYEEDMSVLDTLYNLTPYQTAKTRSTKFCMCIPIINCDNHVVTIITLESIYSIKIPHESEQVLANMITIFSQDLIKYFPILCR